MELDPNDAVADIDGLLISGGADIDPRRRVVFGLAERRSSYSSRGR